MKKITSRQIALNGLVAGLYACLLYTSVSCVVLCAVRHLKPDLVARERENRRKDFGHGVEDHPQRALRRLTDRRVLAVAVEMILDNIEIQARERHDAEIVHGVRAVSYTHLAHRF